MYIHPPHLTTHPFRARSVFVSVIYIHIKKKIYCKNWFMQVRRLRIPRYAVCRLEPRKAVVSFNPSPKVWEPGGAEGRRWMSQLRQPGRKSQILFFLLRASVGWMMPIHTRESKPLYWVHWFKMLISLRNTFTNPPEIMFSQISGHPMIQSGWHII